MAGACLSSFTRCRAALVPEVRIALLAVGLSTAVALPFGIFLSTFTGLQQYVFPTDRRDRQPRRIRCRTHRPSAHAWRPGAIGPGHGGFNLATAATQFFGWRRLVKAARQFFISLFDRKSAVQLAKYGSVMSIWTLAMFFDQRSGYRDRRPLPVQRYWLLRHCQQRCQFHAGAGFQRVRPPGSCRILHAIGHNAEPDWRYCIKTTRYCALLLCFSGCRWCSAAIRCSVYGWENGMPHRALFISKCWSWATWFDSLLFPTSSLWWPPENSIWPRSLRSRKRCVNIVLSIWLVQRIGAVGVAVGTLVGAFVSLSMHLLVSMRYTRPTILIQRSRFLLQGVLRPLLIVTPSLFLYPFWRRLNMLPAPPAVLALWIAATAAIAWWVGVDGRGPARSGVLCAGCYTGAWSRPKRFSSGNAASLLSHPHRY